MARVDALVPAEGAFEATGDELRTRLAALYALPGERWVRVNLVQALNGATVGASGTSDDLTGGVDRVLLGVLRRAADVVLVGAGTLRAEDLPHPRTAVLAVATRRGELTADRIPAAPAGRRVLVLCPAAAAGAQAERLAGSTAEVVALAGAPTPRALVQALAARGLDRVVCEGGAVLASALLDAGIVDEFDQTLAPVPAARAGNALPSAPAATLVGLLRDGTDRLYARWRPRPPSP